ncbi:MAG: DUF6036 family nucleotidyltransferase [Candidatus Thermoplasmatota archaeon]|nr:DUF6036 family nucleotidyltransferase [Candidatus Thermoplasmatota archaeon]
MNSNKRGIDDILFLICDFLNKNDVAYVVVGGIAILFYGNPRTTMDIDIILQLNERDIRNLVHFLEKKDFVVSEEDLRNALKEKSHCTILDKLSILRLDVKGIYTWSDQMTLERRKAVEWRGTVIYIASPEDIIANKLYFGSEQDIKDAESIYVRQLKKLDMKYLEERCGSLNVHNEFMEIKERVERYLKKVDKNEISKQKQKRKEDNSGKS